MTENNTVYTGKALVTCIDAPPRPKVSQLQGRIVRAEVRRKTGCFRPSERYKLQGNSVGVKEFRCLRLPPRYLRIPKWAYSQSLTDNLRSGDLSIRVIGRVKRRVYFTWRFSNVGTKLAASSIRSVSTKRYSSSSGTSTPASMECHFILLPLSNHGLLSRRKRHRFPCGRCE